MYQMMLHPCETLLYFQYVVGRTQVVGAQPEIKCEIDSIDHNMQKSLHDRDDFHSSRKGSLLRFDCETPDLTLLKTNFFLDFWLKLTGTLKG